MRRTHCIACTVTCLALVYVCLVLFALWAGS